MTRAIAWLGMYDHPAEQADNDALWSSIASQLRLAGWEDVPQGLSRDLSPDQAWSHPRLLLAQICVRPWREHHPHLRPLLHPVYPDTVAPGRHRAEIMVAQDSPLRSIDDLVGARVAANDFGSNTGYTLLTDVTGPIETWAGAVVETGSHRASLRAIVDGTADVASIDEITLQTLSRFEPDLVKGARSIGQTHAAPTPPLVTGDWLDLERCEVLRAIVARIVPHAPISQPASQSAR